MDGALAGPGTYAAVAALLLVGIVLRVLDAGLEALGEVRLSALADGDSAVAQTASRVLDRWATVRARLYAGRVVALSCAVALGVAGLPAASLPTARHVGGALGTGLVLAVVYGALSSVGATIARRQAGEWVLRAMRVLRPLEAILAIVAWPFRAIATQAERYVPVAKHDDDEQIAELRLERMIEGRRQEGAIGADHAELLHNVLEFKNTVTHEVMVPRTKMVAFELKTPLQEVLDTVVERGHSRYPIYRDKLDQVVGLLYAKDLFAILEARRPLEQFKMEDLIRRRVFFAVENQKIGTLLREMQARRVHLAVVVDEFGGTSGIITLEDILEEIVGDIRDEYDREQTQVLEVGKETYLVDAGISVYDLEEQLGVRLRTAKAENDYDSVGGLVVGLTGHVPSVGDSLDVSGFRITVRDSDARHVRRVEIRRQSPLPAE